MAPINYSILIKSSTISSQTPQPISIQTNSNDHDLHEAHLKDACNLVQDAVNNAGLKAIENEVGDMAYKLAELLNLVSTNYSTPRITTKALRTKPELKAICDMLLSNGLMTQSKSGGQPANYITIPAMLAFFIQHFQGGISDQIKQMYFGNDNSIYIYLTGSVLDHHVNKRNARAAATQNLEVVNKDPRNVQERTLRHRVARVQWVYQVIQYNKCSARMTTQDDIGPFRWYGMGELAFGCGDYGLPQTALHAGKSFYMAPASRSGIVVTLV